MFELLNPSTFKPSLGLKGKAQSPRITLSIQSHLNGTMLERLLLHFINAFPLSFSFCVGKSIFSGSITIKISSCFSGCFLLRSADDRIPMALDFATLKLSSISISDIEKPETAVAVARWARAASRAAKVGKGLTKDEKAQKLALKYWLEAIDPQHRYGQNLHFYHEVWLSSESSQPFFYWLDVGDGKEVNLEKCPRSELHGQCIKYLGAKEREAYEVIVDNGKLVFAQTALAVNTPEGSKWMFVLGTSRKLYVGEKKKGLFQHSSFLAGAAAIAAGRLVVHDGVLHAIWTYSGHYRPNEESFMEVISFLEEQLDLTNVKMYPVDDDEPPKIPQGVSEKFYTAAGSGTRTCQYFF